MFKKLRTVIYHTNDLQKAKDWYIHVTGVQPYFDEVFYVGFDINGCELGLDPDMSGVKKGNTTVAYWAVDDIETCVEKLKQSGAAVINEITAVGEGINVAVVNDPWGNAVGLIEGA